MKTAVPYISFTFDDFPQSALRTGGAILRKYGFGGTYYASLGLMDQQTPTGKIFSREDLVAALAQGHELGCHTFTHCDSWTTAPQTFEASVEENARALRALLPGASIRSLSYPKSPPRPWTKKRMARRFECCRGGGQAGNVGEMDLSNLKAFFLEQSRGHLSQLKDLIEANCRAKGWLIFATHDVAEEHSGFGCTPEVFEQVVNWASHSGARVLPVTAAWLAMQPSEAPQA